MKSTTWTTVRVNEVRIFMVKRLEFSFPGLSCVNVSVHAFRNFYPFGFRRIDDAGCVKSGEEGIRIPFLDSKVRRVTALRLNWPESRRLVLLRSFNRAWTSRVVRLVPSFQSIHFVCDFVFTNFFLAESVLFCLKFRSFGVHKCTRS